MEKSLFKGLRVLEVLALSDRPLGVAELARDVGLVNSNVHRLLQTLAASGYVRQDAASGHYTCTLKLWEYGAQVAARIDLCRVSRPHLQRLARRTSETVHLSILDNGTVLELDKIESAHAVRAYSRIGGRAPAHCVSSGKALLAFAATDAVRDLGRRLERYSPRTIVRADELERELARVRRQGFAINRGEWRESVSGLAAPVLDSAGQAIAAVGISGPAERLSLAALRAFASPVVECAADISRALGYHGSAKPATRRLRPSPRT